MGSEPGSKEVSVIIPTRNRKELLEFTLLSLYDQSVPSSAFEVVVVDDGSTDGTAELLAVIRPPYRLKVLRNNSNRGAAYSRNQGIKASSGEILIFLDEMLVDSNYIRDHLRCHSKEGLVVTTTFNGQFIYTHFYPGFNPVQQLDCKQVAYRTGVWSRIVDRYGQGEVIRLFRREQVQNHDVLRYGRRDEHIRRFFTAMQEAYGESLERMAAPWIMMVTNGLSVSREMLDEAGLFDEGFKGAWLEDWELGYRLHKAGATFINAKDIDCFHQAHPVSTAFRLENYLYFARKHPDTEVLLIAATGSPFYWTLEQWGKIVTQYRDLVGTGGELRREWTEAFRDLAENLYWFSSEVMAGRFPPSPKTVEERFSRWNPSFASMVQEQSRQLHQESLSSGRYWELLGAFEVLLHLPVKGRRA
ncbi:MAG: glycosyltransferase family 2 protein [Syntrophothermus sp.]